MYDLEIPTGVPTITTSDFEPEDFLKIRFHGLALVRVLPPRNLRYPVLGCKVNGRLLYFCCHACAVERNTTEKCEHR